MKYIMTGIKSTGIKATGIKVSALLLSSVMLFSACASEQPASSGKTNTQQVERGNLLIGHTADGKVALPTTNLNFEVEGIIKSIYFSAGDEIKEGDLLAELDDSDYQLEITNAQNNLDKAVAAYDDAVWQYNYNLKSSLAELESTEKSINEEFDDYSYQNSILDAEMDLINKKKELREAEDLVKDPFDELSYERSIEDAQTTLKTKQEELEEAVKNASTAFDEATYLQNIKDAQKNLETRQTELEKAEKTLRDFILDDYSSNQQSINNAIDTLETEQTELEAALENLKSVIDSEKNKNLQVKFNDSEYANAISTANALFEYREDKYEIALEAYEAARNTYRTAKTVSEQEAALTKLEETEKALEKAYSLMHDAKQAYYKDMANRERAWISWWEDDLSRKIPASVTTAEEELVLAENEYDFAKDSLFKVIIDMENVRETNAENVVNAISAIEDAEISLEKANDSYKDDKDNYASNNEEAVKKATEAVSNAEKSLNRLIEDRAISEENAITSAEEKLESAKEAVENAEKTLERAKTNLQRAYSDYQTQKQDTSDSYSLKLESYEKDKNSNTSIKTAEFNVKEAELALEDAVNKLNKVKIYAPKNGQIVSINQSVGEQVTAKTNTADMFFGTSGSSGSFMVLCDLSEIYLTASITEGDIIGIEVGQTIRVTIDSIGEEEFYGKVNTVSSLPTTDASGITTYTVTAKLDNQNDVIKDGMNCLLTFIKREEIDVLMIPNKAVSIEDNQQYVNVVLADGSYEKRAVSCGLSNGTKTVVLDGLTEGETVVVGKVKD